MIYDEIESDSFVLKKMLLSLCEYKDGEVTMYYINLCIGHFREALDDAIEIRDKLKEIE